MSTIATFRGSGNVNDWLVGMKAKLISKGYKSQLTDANRPSDREERKAWDVLADKALGTILMHLSPDIAEQFEDKQTPQLLINALKSHFSPDQHQAIERLEGELDRLTYNGEDPVMWLSGVKGLVTKLTNKGASPPDRTVRSVVLQALSVEPVYMMRVEVIKQTQPDILLDDLWTAIGRFTYPLVHDDSMFVMRNQLISDSRMNSSAKFVRDGRRLQKEREEEQPTKGLSKKLDDDRIAFCAGLCFNCGKKGHKKFDCPEREVSDDDDRNRRSNSTHKPRKPNPHKPNKQQQPSNKEGRVREKTKDNDDDKSNNKPTSPAHKPRAYALFSKTLDEADHLRVVKKPRGVSGSSSSGGGSSRGREDSRGSDSSRISYQLQQLQQQMQQHPHTTQLQMPYLPDSNRVGVWGECSKVSVSEDITAWMATDPFESDSLDEILSNNMSFRHIGVEPVEPIEGGMEESLVMIVREVVADTGPVYKLTDLFGLLRLSGGAIYNRVDIAGLVLRKLSDQCIKTLVEYEAKLAESTSKLEQRVIWMVWREAALMNILVGDFYQELTRHGNKMCTLERWLGMAGLDMQCAHTPNIITAAQGWAMIRMESRDMNTNIVVCLGELVRCECRLLLEKHKSFAWLSDIRLVSLVGVSGEALLGDRTPTLALVTSLIIIAINQHWGNRVSLGEIHSIMSKLDRSDPLDSLYSKYDLIDDKNLLTNFSQHEDKDDGAKIAISLEKLDVSNKNNSVVINYDDVTNCNKINNCNFDDNFSHTTHTNISEWCEFNSEVQKALNKDDLSQCWIADSGATKHMTGNKEWLSELRRSSTGIQGGNGQMMKCEGIGTVSLLTNNLNGQKIDITLNDVLYVPGMKVNLFSITRAATHGGATIVIKGDLLHMKIDEKDEKSLAVGKYVNDQQLYILDCTVNIPDVGDDKCFAAREIGSNSYSDLMHKRLLHTSASKMVMMHKTADGVKQMLHMQPHNCKVCSEMKANTAARSCKPIQKASRPLERVHIDNIGPFPKSERGYVYACMITDSYTSRHWALLCKKKSNSYSKFAEWAKSVEALTGEKLKYIRCDNGGEFDNEAFRTWAGRNGYKFECTAPYTPSQNGLAE